MLDGDFPLAKILERFYFLYLWNPINIFHLEMLARPVIRLSNRTKLVLPPNPRNLQLRVYIEAIATAPPLLSIFIH